MEVYTVMKQGRLRSGIEASGSIVHCLEKEFNFPKSLKKLKNQNVNIGF